MKVAIKVPRSAWVPVSRMKLPRRRGPNWDEVSERTTIVMEKTTPAVVIMEPATVERSVRAPSGPQL